MASSAEETPADFAGRLRLAMELEGRTPTRTEREAGLKRGYMTQLKSGDIKAPGPETIRQLADYLHVSYEWLAIGRGSIRAEGWEPSALEDALKFARRHNTREDAIEGAQARFEREGADMTAMDWILAIDAEARRLDRAHVPTPSARAQSTRRTRRLITKRARLLGELAEIDAKTAKPTPTRRPKKA